MLPSNSNENQDSQIRDFYRSIGQFAVTFEHLCNSLQMGITAILGRQGLKNQAVGQILVSGLTAEPLKALLQSLISETRVLTTADQQILDSIFKRLQKLIEERNDVIHSTTFVGWGNENDLDFSQAMRTKLGKNKSGAAFKSKFVSIESMDKLSQEADALWKIFLRLNGCLLADFSIESNFSLNPDGSVSIPES